MPSTHSCLSEETISGFINGQLGDAERERVDDHIETCAECRGLVADSARSLHEATTDTLAVTHVSDRPARRHTPLRPGAAVGRYVVGELIGVGGMGVIYLAQDPQLNRTITLKLLRDDRRADQAQLLREAQAMAQLSHPNVVAVYDVGTYGTQVFVAMEFVDGETLTQWLRRGGRRSLREISAVFLDAGRALAAAHAVGIVHRDFKPANVLLGADGRVRVSDFGLARPVDVELSSAKEPERSMMLSSSDFGDWDLAMTLTETGAVKGTPAYMAPEQFAGGAVDERTDQFSFCVALYEALYGHRPFSSTSMEDLARQVLRGQVSIPAEDRRVPPSVRDALLRGLSVRPEDRYPAMQDLLDLLSDATHEPAARRRRPLARAPVVGAAIVLIGGGGLALLVAAGVFRPSAPQEPRATGAPPVARTDAAAVSTKTPARADAAVRSPRRKRRAHGPARVRSARRRRAAGSRAKSGKSSGPAPPIGKSLAPVPQRPYDDEPLVPSFARER